MVEQDRIIKVKPFLLEIPQTYRKKMRVPARIFATMAMLSEIADDMSLDQIVNVAQLPGIQESALAMPDIHQGYGFPIGGVAAFDIDNGIISPGGIGYDINCGVRLLKSEKTQAEIKYALTYLGRAIYQEVPSGVGKTGSFNYQGKELDLILEKGSKRISELGFADALDLEKTESRGSIGNANPDYVSKHAKDRGHNQLGTLGAGNHFIEVGVVQDVYDEVEASKMGLFKNQVTIMIHTGSRGLGHQIATDYIQTMQKTMPKHGITVPDQELVCLPFKSSEGQQYFQAMSAGANFAWANRQLITYEVRKAWKNVFGKKAGTLQLIYDVAHNIAKTEEHLVKGKKQKVVVHRKGATRSFPGQPVLIPGSMGTESYVMVGQETAMQTSFGSCSHGAGRRMSRTKARKQIQAKDLLNKLQHQGIVIEAGSLRGIAEEAPRAYKDVNQVVNIIHEAGIAKKVVRLKPLVVVKG